jgi:hypothetical protein
MLRISLPLFPDEVIRCIIKHFHTGALREPFAYKNKKHRAVRCFLFFAMQISITTGR